MNKTKLFSPGKIMAFDRRVFMKHIAVAFAALTTYSLNPRISLAKTLMIKPESESESESEEQFAIQTTDVLRYHTVIVDETNQILPWYTPIENAYDNYLDQLWAWLPNVPNGPSSSLPMYYLYCGFRPGNPITPDSYENDWGERIPNFVEFGRLYYAYSGNMVPLNIAKNLADYALAHGMTPSNYMWPNFPYSTANGGATEINGDNVAWNQNYILIDHCAEIGGSFYRLYLVYGTSAYHTAAINIANTLASKIETGSATNSPWPYVVNASSGETISRYTSNFAGALRLFDILIEHGEPNAAAYTVARQILKNWILLYPMRNGNWVDGHSDVFIDGNTNWSNTTKSNMNLYLLDNPDFDPNFLTNVPKLLQWTEDYMVNVSTNDGLSGQYFGASVVAEQFAYMMRMGYQTSRQAAEYAGWYEVNGDETYKNKAYRGFNYSTYMMKSNGEASDGPTDSVGFWWSDVYGEGPRMFFYGFKAVPEWAPPRENHILYSKTILKNVTYAFASVQYTATDNQGTEYLRLAFLPSGVTVNGEAFSLVIDLNAQNEGYTVRDLGNGDYAVVLKRARIGDVIVSSGVVPITFTVAATAGTGGTINPLGSLVVNQQTSLTFSITANSGYAIADVNVDGVSVGAVTSYTFTNIIINHTIAASFSATTTGGIIGYNGNGTRTDTISDASGTYINATRFLATANLNVTTMKAKVLGITGKYKCAIYSDNNGSPQNLLKESSEVTNPATGWQTFNLTSAQSIQNGTYYWLAIWSSLRSTSAAIYCDATGATTRWTSARTYGTWPSPVTTVGGNSYRFCIYAEASGNNLPPTVATAASASINPVTGTSASLSVLGADDGGETNLSYTWATTGTPPAPVSFSANGMNAAKNTTATFTKAGIYNLLVTIKDQANLTVTSSVTVTVNQTLTAITVSPTSVSVVTGATQQFTATAKDQFTSNLIAPPTVAWSISGGGTINLSGLLTAGNTAGGPFVVTATSGVISGTASVTITSVNKPPTVATAALASPNPVTGTATSLSVLGADDGGEASLSYAWATTGTPPAPVSFSANGTNAAKNTTATFTKAGSYNFQVTIKDQANLTVTSSVTVTVNQTLTALVVSPASANVTTGATQQFTATAKDQFAANLIVPPTVAWSVSGGGTISTNGLFTAGNSTGGPFTVTVTSSGKSGSANISVTAGINILGNNLIGTSNDVSGANDLNCWRFQGTSSFNAKFMRINLASALTGRMKLAIYGDNNGSPGALLMTTNEVINPASGWVTFSLTSGYTITPGSYYWLAAWSNVRYTPKYQTSGGTARYIVRTYSSTWPNPLTGTLGPYSNYESIYAY